MEKLNTFSQKTKELGNTGFKQLVENKLGVIVGALVSLDGGLDFASADDVLDISKWEEKMKLPKSQRVFMLPLFDAFNDRSTDDVFNTSLQGEKFNEWGKVQFDAMLDVNTYLGLNLNGLNGKDIDIALIDTSCSLIMKENADGTYSGFSCRIHVGKPKFAAQGEKMLTPITVIITSTEDFVYSRAVAEPLYAENSWNPKTDLDGVYDVELSVSNISETGCKIKVLKKSINQSLTSAGVGGLTKTDFILKSSLGVVKTITTLEPSDVEYIYDLAATLENGDVISLVPCSSISLTSIKIEGANSVTISGIV